MVPFTTKKESTGEFVETPVIGGFSQAAQAQSFDTMFSEAADELSRSSNNGIKIREDINDFIKNPDAIESFKENLLSGIVNESAEAASSGKDMGYFNSIYDQCSQLYDNTVSDLMTESVTVGNLLPIKAIDLPLVIKKNIRQTSSVILNSKVTPSPVIKKQIERTYVVDPETKKRYQYPQCLFNGEWEQIHAAAVGLPIKNDKQTLPLFNFDIVDTLTDATVPEREKITIDINIPSVYLADGTEVKLKRPIRTNLADGAWIGGQIHQTITVPDPSAGTDATKEVEVNDVLSGFVNWTNNTCTLTSASGQITAVSFAGRISNEKNERGVTFDYDREDIEWKIEDGPRAYASYSLEELQDYQALIKEDLYRKTYNNIGNLMTDLEDNTTYKFLDDEFKKYDGVEFDLLDFNPFVSHKTFDCDPTQTTTALPYEFISQQLKFEIDRFLIAIADSCKIEDLTFVIFGNPRYVSLLDPNVTWVKKAGQSLGGVKLDYSYGIMTSGDISINVVSVMKLDSKKYDSLRFVAYSTDNSTITMEHYKYASHIATSKDSAYRDPNLPGGSQTYVMGTSRYKNISLQSIQADMDFVNAEFVNLRR